MRDVLKLKTIVTHYIKTLFLWKVSKTSKKYWESKTSVLFKTMVQELYDAISGKNIPCYWHKKHNLLANLGESSRIKYADKLKNLLHDIETENVNKVLEALLTDKELATFKNLDIYKKYSTTHKQTTSSTKGQGTNVTTDHNGLVINLFDKMEALSGNFDKLIDSLDKLNVAGSSKAVCSGTENMGLLPEQCRILQQRIPVEALKDPTSNSEDSDSDYSYRYKRLKLANGTIGKVKRSNNFHS